MALKQLSVFVENKPGRLAEITSILQQNNVDIRALSVADTTNFGILRLIVDRPVEAEAALRQAGFTVSQTEVIAIGVDDRPGGLAVAMKCLYEAGVSVEYMYAFISREVKTAYVILRVENNASALKALQAGGIPVVDAEEIFQL